MSGRSSRWCAERLLCAGALLLAAVLYIIAAPATVSAARGDEAVPVVVTARKLVADNKTKTVTYSGDVSVTRGAVRLTSPEVVIRMEGAGDGGGESGSPEGMFGGGLEVGSIEATGGVKVIHGDKTLVSERAVYDTGKETIVMEGSPKAWQGPNVLSGTRIIYDIESDTITVEGARTIIYPEGEGIPIPGIGVGGAAE